MIVVASAATVLTLSKAALACAEPFSAVSRNACVASALEEPLGFVVLVWESIMHLSLGRVPLRISGSDTLGAGRIIIADRSAREIFQTPVRSCKWLCGYPN